MRIEFSKNNLAPAIEEAGIRYIHVKEVGIDSIKRKELLPKGKRIELFKWYRDHVLPSNSDFPQKVNLFLEKGSVAFLCYEKDAKDCHRSYLADFCLKQLDKPR